MLGSDLPSPVRLTDDPLLPASARNDSEWTRADVTIDALRDSRLVGPSQPVAYDTKEIKSVQYEVGGVARASKYLPRGAEYTAWGYAPQPSPAKLAKSPAIYPPEIELDGRYLGLPHGGAVPPFGSSEHALWASAYFRDSDEGRRYRPLYDARRGTSRATPTTPTRPPSRSRPGSGPPDGSSTTSTRRGHERFRHSFSS